MTYNNRLRTKTYNMTESEFESINEVPINDEFLAALREAGASRLMQDVVQLSGDELPEGVDRNSARLEVQKYCYWENEISTEAFENNKNLGGHFFQTLWEGDYDGAWSRADRNNQRILEKVDGGKSTGVISL